MDVCVGCCGVYGRLECVCLECCIGIGWYVFVVCDEIVGVFVGWLVVFIG